MSRQSTPLSPTVADSRPLFIDFLALLFGLSLSVFITGLAGVQTHAKSIPQTRLEQTLLATHPFLLFAQLGVVLLWPMFYWTQQIAGRNQPLTIGEWLWGLAWLAMLLFGGWLVWNGVGTVPEFMNTGGFRRGMLLGYVVAVVALGAIALVLCMVDLFSRRPTPWTHALGLALLIWPIAPLAAMWIWRLELRFV